MNHVARTFACMPTCNKRLFFVLPVRRICMDYMASVVQLYRFSYLPGVRWKLRPQNNTQRKQRRPRPTHQNKFELARIGEILQQQWETRRQVLGCFDDNPKGTAVILFITAHSFVMPNAVYKIAFVGIRREFRLTGTFLVLDLEFGRLRRGSWREWLTAARNTIGLWISSAEFEKRRPSINAPANIKKIHENTQKQIQQQHRRESKHIVQVFYEMVTCSSLKSHYIRRLAEKSEHFMYFKRSKIRIKWNVNVHIAAGVHAPTKCFRFDFYAAATFLGNWSTVNTKQYKISQMA